MNERIKELMLHAGTDTSGKWMGVEHAEKFAELIVKECMTICEDVAERNDPAIACYYEIKRTFRS
jgi:hypothetical protein